MFKSNQCWDVNHSLQCQTRFTPNYPGQSLFAQEVTFQKNVNIGCFMPWNTWQMLSDFCLEQSHLATLPKFPS